MTRAVVIATPVPPHGVLPQFTFSLLESKAELLRHGIDMGWMFYPNLGLCHIARNILAASFMAQTRADTLVWADADQEWDPDALLRLLSHDVDVVAAPVALKRAGAGIGHRARHGANGKIMKNGAGLIELLVAGCGFTAIKRQVFVRMAEAYPETKIGPEPWQYDFHPSRLEADGTYTTEDWAFASRWRHIGGQIWCDPTIRVRHWGLQAFDVDATTAFKPPGR